jgi:hypothetical protein
MVTDVRTAGRLGGGTADSRAFPPGLMTGPTDNSTDDGQHEHIPDYAQWLVRISQTYEAVANCCYARLRDRAVAEEASTEVIAGLLARPMVWRFYGLPFSGRVAMLTEKALAAANERARPGAGRGGWIELRSSLARISQESQEVFVMTCVDGYGDPELAGALGCEEEDAKRRRDAMLQELRELSSRTLSPTGRQHEQGESHHHG